MRMMMCKTSMWGWPVKAVTKLRLVHSTVRLIIADAYSRPGFPIGGSKTQLKNSMAAARMPPIFVKIKITLFRSI